MAVKYSHTIIEKKWQDKWESEKLYVADIAFTKKPTFFNLWMFPYPSAEGLHAGHAFASTGSDVYGRFMRMNGHEVFQPIGYDSFGIHSENYAIKINQDPHEVVKRTTANYEKQMRSLGHGYDWTRTVTTSDSDYYKWTQWLFLKMYEAGLAYKKKASVNFCPSCKTVLADEQVMSPKQAGKEPKNAQGEVIQNASEDIKVCERCGTVAEKRDLDQWFFKITDYADRLLDGIEKIDWSKRVLLAQKEWIGKSEGMKIKFKIKGSDESIEVFTTRPDTLESATFMATWSDKLETPEKTKEKIGVFTGRYAINPFNNRELPIWETNYVAKDYGTGYVMGVPAYDERDMDFAKKYSIDILNKELDDSLWEKIEGKGWGIKHTNYHLRDWLVSRQRYWGAPIPMIECAKCGWVPVPEKDLPVLLPSIKDYKPEGEGKGPLANHKEFYSVTCPKCGEVAKRETDVMDTFVDSSWYFLRYPSVGIDNVPFDTDITKHWLPVDLYFGGAEHSVLHLMYARFVTKVLYDLKLLAFDEPFPKFFAHGLMIKDGAKMSKSRGNVVNPDEYVKKFGADVMRMYEMFLGPMDGNPDFRDSGIEGMQRFLGRVWRLFNDSHSGGQGPIETQQDLTTSLQDDIKSKLHQTIKGVTEDIKLFKYNTAIAKIMELVNTLTEVGNKSSEDGKEDGELKFEDRNSDIKNQTSIQNSKLNHHTSGVLSALARLLAPFAPHMMEEVWVEYLHQPFSIHNAEWPVYDPKMIMQSEANITIQINGKVRSQLKVASDESKDQEKIEKIAKEDENVAKYLEGQTIKKTIFIPSKIVNFVV